MYKRQIEIMKKKYKSGGYGYGHAKTELFELIISKYKNQRNKYADLMSNKQEIDLVLNEGARKAQAIASKVLARVKTKLGF